MFFQIQYVQAGLCQIIVDSFSKNSTGDESSC